MSLLPSQQKALLLSKDIGRMSEREQRKLASEMTAYKSRTGFTVRERLRKKLPPKPVDHRELVESYESILSLMRVELSYLRGSKDIEALKKAILAMEQSRDEVAKLIHSSE